MNSGKIAKIMNSSQLAIVSPSVILHEVFYMEIPFIAIKTASNQNDIYNFIKSSCQFTLEHFCRDKFKLLLELKLKEIK